MLDHLIQHIADPQFSGCGDRHRFADSQIIKFIDFHHLAFKVVHFIDGQNHRLAAAPEHIRHLCVRIHQTLAHVGDKDDHIRSVNGNLCLFPHL